MPTKTVITPLGTLKVLEQNSQLVDLSWDDSAEDEGSSPLLEQTVAQLDAYFSGKSRDFKLPYTLVGTPFQQQVWQQIAAIPYGQTRTYKDLAGALKTSPRPVGTACGRNPLPLVVPCHRVLGSGGALHGFSGGEGLATKAALLSLESDFPATEHGSIWRGMRAQLPHKPFYFMRHGQTEMNVTETLQGWADGKLTEHGRAMAVAAGEAYSHLPISHIFSSTLSRAAQTADLFLKGYGQNVTINPMDHFKERGLGAFEGQHKSVYVNSAPDARRPWKTPPEGESWLQVVTRIHEGLGIALQHAETPLIISHGAAFGAMAELLGFGSGQTRLGNCELFRLVPPQKRGGAWTLEEVAKNN